MARREPTQPVDFLRDVVWGDDEGTQPNAVFAVAARAVTPAPPPQQAAPLGDFDPANPPRVPSTITDLEPAAGEAQAHPAPPARSPLAGSPTTGPGRDAALLRRMLEFAQWERVAMVRFGLATASWATTHREPPAGPRRVETNELSELRRNWERAKAIARDNHETLLKALDEVAAKLNLTDGDWI